MQVYMLTNLYVLITHKKYAADTVTCAFLRFRLVRHGGKFSKPTEPFNQHALGIYSNAARK